MRKNGICSTFKKEKEKVHQFLLNTFGSATIPLSAAWTMIFVIHLRSIWISISFSFLYNCDLTSVILFCCTRSFSIQDHIYFLSSLERIASKVILFSPYMSLCNIQSLELGGYVYVGDIGMEIYLVFLRTEAARRQVTKIIYFKMSVIICSMFAYWIYNLLGFFS